MQVLILFFWVFFIPIVIVKFIFRATWPEIGITYTILVCSYILMVLYMLVDGATWEEATGWPILIFLFWTIPIVIVLTILLKLKAVIS